jgi:coatomer subunit beta
VQTNEDVGRATGAAEIREDFISNLKHITQLTGWCLSIMMSRTLTGRAGFSDPIYAEAYVKVHGFDIMLGLSRGNLGGNSR